MHTRRHTATTRKPVHGALAGAISSWRIVIAMVACCAVISCGEPSGKPASSNRPYQAVIFGDDGGSIAGELTDTVEGLPQREQRFDVTTVADGELNEFQRLARAIVRIKYDKSADKANVTCKQDVYARPQIVVTITARDRKSLKDYISGHKGTISNLLETFEISTAVKALKRQHNEKAEQDIRRLTGMSMSVPADMKASKRGRDFIWLSNNTTEGLENICAYRVRGRVTDFTHVRDSVMRANIPGERSGMYMETERAWLSKPASTGIHLPEGSVLYRGLWDMKGDVMGGPFISLTLWRKPYTIVIEGFVYAPEGKKRNRMRRLEACLYSSVINKGNNK